MTHILSVQSSGRGDASITRQLSEQVIARLDGDVVERDLRTSIPHVDGDWIVANFTPVADRTAAQSATLAFSDSLVEEIQAADILVLGVPIYNFGVPAAFKAWFDMVARAGLTFKYTETGPIGLLADKRAILVIASGGTQVGSDIDFATPWLRQALGFIGIHEIDVIAADQLGQNADTKLAAVRNQIDALNA